MPLFLYLKESKAFNTSGFNFGKPIPSVVGDTVPVCIVGVSIFKSMLVKSVMPKLKSLALSLVTLLLTPVGSALVDIPFPNKLKGINFAILAYSLPKPE